MSVGQMVNFYPEMITWSLREKARYIRGFADGEGGPRFYRWKGAQKGHHYSGDMNVRAVAITNSDKRLLNTVQIMLGDLGIKSHIYIDIRKGERKATKNAWSLKILDKKSLIKFSKAIGFSETRKSNILKEIVASYK